MNILGVHIGHDSSAALVKDGQIISDVAEERFTRTKHYAGLPIQAIEYCLSSNNFTIKDIDIIAIPSSGPVPELNFLFDLKGSQKEHQRTPGRILNQIRRIMQYSSMGPPLYIKKFPLGVKTKIIHIDHHLAHAASAYYTSGSKDKQVIVTLDGAGDGFSTCVWLGESGDIKPLLKLGTNSSLGWFYSNVTEALGWWHGDGEGKTMGLAPYGDFKKTLHLLDKFHPKFKDGALVQQHSYGQPFVWNESGAIQWHFDQANKIQDIVDKHGSEDIAAEAQRVLEEQVMEIIIPWLKKQNTDRLSCAGGVFLNVKLNQRIWEKANLSLHHIFPNPGDSGLAVGAALYAYYQVNPKANVYPLDNIYWGPSYSNKEIREVLDQRNLTYKTSNNVASDTAKLLAQNKIIGWFQGRMESGPRALGGRSILMSATKSENKDIINAKVKFREAFRPFCPSILEEKFDDYLLNTRKEPFMVTSFNAEDKKKDKIPAVVHVDGTVRPQTVSKQANTLYWNLLKEFGDLTGEPILLNTSMNIKGEPIVCHPREAIRCFFDTGMDALVIGNFILEK